ncbi:MAG: hypothetical protein QNK37_11155, partial [Acidobacteriota bacterium]|nr:hypothetical protein [Acidobacteriota bacterium]
YHSAFPATGYQGMMKKPGFPGLKPLRAPAGFNLLFELAPATVQTTGGAGIQPASGYRESI